jgi:hypothetical protein
MRQRFRRYATTAPSRVTLSRLAESVVPAPLLCNLGHLCRLKVVEVTKIGDTQVSPERSWADTVMAPTDEVRAR